MIPYRKLTSLRAQARGPPESPCGNAVNSHKHARRDQSGATQTAESQTNLVYTETEVNSELWHFIKEEGPLTLYTAGWVGSLALRTSLQTLANFPWHFTQGNPCCCLKLRYSDASAHLSHIDSSRTKCWKVDKCHFLVIQQNSKTEIKTISRNYPGWYWVWVSPGTRRHSRWARRRSCRRRHDSRRRPASDRHCEEWVSLHPLADLSNPPPLPSKAKNRHDIGRQSRTASWIVMLKLVYSL